MNESLKFGKHFRRIVSNYYKKNVETFLFLKNNLRGIDYKISLSFYKGFAVPTSKKFNVDNDIDTNFNDYLYNL